MFGSRPDVRHIRAFGSLTYCHTPREKRKKLSMNCRVGFLIGYHENIVGCHVYFPTEHMKGYVSDVKINEAVKYKDRFDSGYTAKVRRWLQTLSEYAEEGAFNDSISEESEVSHLTDIIASMDCNSSTIQMETAESETSTPTLVISRLEPE